MKPPTRFLLFENGASLGTAVTAVGGGGKPMANTVVLEPSGACFTEVREDGSCYRQLSDYCRRDLVPHVAAVSSFRNTHSSRPYLSRRIHATSAQPEESGGVSRTRKALFPGRIARWPVHVGWKEGASGSHRCCATMSVDGAVEIRAAGGNARLTLSASRTTAEVDYAVAIPGPSAYDARPTPRAVSRERESPDGSGLGIIQEQEEQEVMTRARRANGCTTGRVWVTRRFFVGSGRSDVPPEFSHALGVALEASQSSVAAASAARTERSVGCAGETADGGAVVGGDREGWVEVELPRPEERPDHASWDTIQHSPGLESYPDLGPLGYEDRRSLRWRGGSATTTATGAATGGLLSVDVMRIAQDQGFAGGLAAVVESTGGCTYRIIIGLDRGDGSAGGHRGRGSEDVNVHVVVHADETEIWMEGDFVRLVRPLPPATAQQRHPRPREQHLLHVSAASTFHFRVPSLPRPPSRSQQPVGKAAATVPANVVGLSGNEPSASAAAADGRTSVSLGEIASRAMALRRQYLRCSVRAARARIGSSGVRPNRENESVKIKPPTSVVPAGLSSRKTATAGTTEPSAPAALTRRRRRLEAHLLKGPAVLESVERGGASFVAFADGRARGAFADRTIVTLGAIFFYRRLLGERRGYGCGGRYVGGRGGAGTAQRSGEDLGVEEEEDREIECVCPDGTVVRLTERSMDAGRFRSSSGGYSPVLQPMPQNTTSCNDGGRGVTASSAASAAKERHGGSATTPTSTGRCFASSALALRPYVVAVLRFADWAATPPAQRRAAAEREAAGRMAAAAEAERNRRFVELQRVVRYRPCDGGVGGAPVRDRPMAGEIDQEPAACGILRWDRVCGREANAIESFLRRRPEHGTGGGDDDDSKENCQQQQLQKPGSDGFVFGARKQGSVGPEQGPPNGARERNSLVAGLLEANREVLLGKDMSRKFRPRRLFSVAEN